MGREGELILVAGLGRGLNREDSCRLRGLTFGFSNFYIEINK